MESDEATASDAQPSSSNQDEQQKEADLKLSQEFLQRAAGLIRAANALPKLGDNYEICASYAKYRELMEISRKRLAVLLYKVYSTAGVKIRLPRQDDHHEFVDRITDANDIIMERAGIMMDEISKAHRKEIVQVPKAISQAESTIRTVQGATSSTESPSIFTKAPQSIRPLDVTQMAKFRALSRHNEVLGKVAHIKKPQKEFGFEKYIDNSSASFVSKLTTKHHRYQPSKSHGVTIHEEGDMIVREDRSWLNDETDELNPYSIELQHFTVPEDQLISREPLPYKPLDETTLTLVNDVEKAAYFERAVLGSEDFKGISWSRQGYRVAALRGIWVYQNIAYNTLLTRCVKYNSTRNSRRPIGVLDHSPKEMMHYAREDTHYLLYCYDLLRERLLQSGNERTNNLLEDVYRDSKEICKKVFEKHLFDPEGFTQIIASKRNLNNRQIFALRELWRWRDTTARNQDESLGYVLPSHMMIHIAESLPRDMQGILACCSPVPHPLKEHLLLIHRIILEARDRELEMVETAKKVVAEGETLATMRSRQQQSNQIDELKGRLFTHLNIHFAEKEHSLKNLSQKDDIKVEEVTDNDIMASILESELSARVQQKLIKTFTDPLPVYELDKKARALKGAHQLLNKLSEGATPYECYQLAIKERDKRLEAQQEADKQKAQDAPKEKRFSHHDPTINRKTVVEETPVVSLEEPLVKQEPVESVESKERTPFNDHQVLTKKALKRKMQQAKQNADVRLSAPAPKRITKNEPSTVDFKPVDYSALAQQTFGTCDFDMPSDNDYEWTPFNHGVSIGGGGGKKRGGRENSRGGGRGRGGHGRGGQRGNQRGGQSNRRGGGGNRGGSSGNRGGGSGNLLR
ncbi:unnamed protein product, partial [Mesorhabditis belari]|uniref:HRDC domain-containing protein n=1 Tax=Mesorhabditis belari TaxID=2138241 RepID=A0AAF3FJ64_9BILA